MSKTFSKIGKEMAVAIKSGGPNPESNYRLRVLIQNAKAANMPKDNVERIIKKYSSTDATEDYKEMVYEGYGPHGIAIVVETLTDNINRTVASVRSILTRAGGSLGTSGSLDFLFDRKCVFKIKNTGQDLEELELELIDFGVDELFAEEDQIVLYGDFKAFREVQEALEKLGFEIISAEFERIPNDQKELSEEQQADIDKMLDKFDEDDDVQNVFHNMA